MVMIEQVATVLQTVLRDGAAQAGHDSGFVRRQSKFDGAALVQTLVFGYLANPDASLSQLTATAAAVGIPITKQGLEQRLGPQAAACLHAVLEQAVTTLLRSDPVAIPLLQRFNGVYVLDSTVISLPAALAAVWHGCGNQHTASPKAAALKLVVQWNLTCGDLTAVECTHGRTSDHATATQHAVLPPQALRLADLGFFSLPTLRTLAARGGYWLTRIRCTTALFAADGCRIELVAFLRREPQPWVDLAVQVGTAERLPCRLLAVRVSAQEAATRRRRIRAEAKRRGRTPTAVQLALAAWTILITNVPASLLTIHEAMVVIRVRWQIELLFKLWKSHGKVDESRSTKPWRVLCDVYAKLLVMVVQHWVVLTSVWVRVDKSLPQAAHTIQQHALHLACAMWDQERLADALNAVRSCLDATCRMGTRQRQPYTYQLLVGVGGETDHLVVGAPPWTDERMPKKQAA